MEMSAQLAGTVFDRESALQNVDGDAGLLKEIANLFLGEYPKDLRTLRDAADRGDAELVERTAHGLKGSVSNFGARLAVETAKEVETLGRERRLSGIAPVLDHLEQALAALRHELEGL